MILYRNLKQRLDGLWLVLVNIEPFELLFICLLAHILEDIQIFLTAFESLVSQDHPIQVLVVYHILFASVTAVIDVLDVIVFCLTIIKVYL